MKITDIIILAVLAGLIILALAFMRKRRKKGGCCGSCSGCRESCSHRMEDKLPEEKNNP
jgi:hypothetical protein